MNFKSLLHNTTIRVLLKQLQNFIALSGRVKGFFNKKHLTGKEKKQILLYGRLSVKDSLRIFAFNGWGKF